MLFSGAGVRDARKRLAAAKPEFAEVLRETLHSTASDMMFYLAPASRASSSEEYKKPRSSVVSMPGALRMLVTASSANIVILADSAKMYGAGFAPIPSGFAAIVARKTAKSRAHIDGTDVVAR